MWVDDGIIGLVVSALLAISIPVVIIVGVVIRVVVKRGVRSHIIVPFASFMMIAALAALACEPSAPNGPAAQSNPTATPTPTPEVTNPPTTRNPKLGSVLNARVVEYEKQRSSQSGATGQAEPARFITVEISLTTEGVDGIRRFLKDNQGSVTLVIKDPTGSYLEANVPVSLLDRLSQRLDVLVVSTTEQLYPNLADSLNDLLAEYEAGFLSAEEAAARAPQHDGLKINVHFEIECEHFESIRSFSSARGGFLHPEQVDDKCADSTTTDHI